MISIPWCYLEVGLQTLHDGDLFEVGLLGALLVGRGLKAGGLKTFLQKDVQISSLPSSELRGREGVIPVRPPIVSRRFELQASAFEFPAYLAPGGKWGSGMASTPTSFSMENPA